MNKHIVKQLLSSDAWPEIAEFLRTQIDADLKTDGLKVEEIGLHYLARQMAKDRLDLALSRLQALADQETFEQKNYI